MHAIMCVEQAVTLVFEHVLTDSADSAQTAPVDASASAKVDSSSRAGPIRSDSTLLAEHGAANAALKLLDELCMMATGMRSCLLAPICIMPSYQRLFNAAIPAHKSTAYLGLLMLSLIVYSIQ